MASKIVILGATGPSGQQLVKLALEKGLAVTAVVRNPEKLQTTHDNLKVVQADIFSSDSLTPHFIDQDAVMSCLGHRGSLWSRVTFYTDCMKPIVQAMRQAKVNRLVCMTAWCTVYERGNPFFIEWVLKPLLLGRVLRNMGEMENWMFQECEDINYTFVRPPQLVNGPVTELKIAAVEGQFVPNTRGPINRADVARFMLTTLEDRQWDKKAVAITTVES